MNYYYEIDPKYDSTPHGDKWRWWCMANCSPADNGKMCFKTHDEFSARSSRVWVENVNGVYQVKPDWYGMRGGVDPHEFTLVKLRAKTIKWWQDEPG
jgi:hypothetical protein